MVDATAPANPTNRSRFSIIVAASAVLAISLGVRQALGLFFAPIHADMHWAGTVFAIALAVQNLVWGVCQPFAGLVADKFGTTRTVFAGALFYAAGLGVAWGFRAPSAFELGVGPLIGIGLSSTSFAILLAAVGRAVPDDKRSVALGLASAGGSFGQVAVPPIAQLVIGTLGWSGALGALFAIAALMVPLTAALRGSDVVAFPAVGARAEEPVGQAIGQALALPSFWFLNFGFFVCGFHVAFLTTHLPFFEATVGLPAFTGAASLALIGIFNMGGTFAAGMLGARYPKRYLLSAIFALRTLALTAFLAMPVTLTSTIVFSAAIGVLWLSTVPLTSGVVSHIFGPRWLATLFGIVFFSHQVGAFFGSWLGGVAYDATGSYTPMWIACIALSIVATIVHLPIVERPLVIAPQLA